MPRQTASIFLFRAADEGSGFPERSGRAAGTRRLTLLLTDAGHLHTHADEGVAATGVHIDGPKPDLAAIRVRARPRHGVRLCLSRGAAADPRGQPGLARVDP